MFEYFLSKVKGFAFSYCFLGSPTGFYILQQKLLLVIVKMRLKFKTGCEHRWIYYGFNFMCLQCLKIANLNFF